MIKFNLGDRLKDTITGCTGIAVSRSEWLNGCIRYEIQNEEPKDGISVESQWFDESQLVLVKAKAWKPIVEREGKPPEGSRPAPQRARDPQSF